nr:uncharacterized protein LOC111422033 isoform X2 [Onthophagus taurus]
MFKLYTWPLFFVSIIIIEASSVNSNKQCVRCNDICAGMYAYILQCSNNWAHCEHEMLDIFLNSGHNVKDAKKECYAFFDHIGCKEGTIICDRLLILMTEHIEG